MKRWGVALFLTGLGLVLFSGMSEAPSVSRPGVAAKKAPVDPEMGVAMEHPAAFEPLVRSRTRPEASPYDFTLKTFSRRVKDAALLQIQDESYDPTRKGFKDRKADWLDVSIRPEHLETIERLNGTEYRLVQFEDAPDFRTVERIRESGLNPVAYVPNRAYVIAVPADRKAAFGALSGVRWQGAFPVQAKVGPNLRAMLNDDPADSLVLVSAYRIESMEGWDDLALRLGAAEVLFMSEVGPPQMMLRVPAKNLAYLTAALTKLEALESIQLFSVPETKNYGSIWVLQSGDAELKSTPLFDAGLTGYGQIYGEADSGVDTDACQFRFSGDAADQTLASEVSPPRWEIAYPDNKILSYYILMGSTAYDDTSGHFHGTMTSGCAVGDNYQNLASIDSPGLDFADGMAPAARLVFQDAGTEAGYLIGLAFHSPWEISAQAYNTGVRVHNNSYGSQNPMNGYDSRSANIDDFIWQFPEYNVYYSAGNEGPEEKTLGGEGSTAKNTLAVGASSPGWYEGGGDILYFSSRGPTTDGRLKPDLVAPGLIKSATETESKKIPGLTDVYGQPAAESLTVPPNNQCGTSQTQGTSFSSPTAGGMALLARQYFMDGFYPSGTRNPDDGFTPSSALVRAVMVNSSRNLEGDILNYGGHGLVSAGAVEPAPSTRQGWGRITLDDALYLRGDRRDLMVFADVANGSEDALVQGDEADYEIVVKAGEPLKITLAWVDPAGRSHAGVALVNDLDLVVAAPNGKTYHGNINFASGVSQHVNSEDDTDAINSLEQIILDAPAAGTYGVTVRASSVPGNGSSYPTDSAVQGYALIATGNLFEGADELLPRVSIKQFSISGGCDNDNFLDPNESALLVADVVNSGDGDSNSLVATISLVESETEIDANLIRLPENPSIPMDVMTSRSRSEVEIPIGLAATEENVCEKRVTFKVEITDAQGGVQDVETATILLGLDSTDDGMRHCQEIPCSPPAEIEEISPAALFVGQTANIMEFKGNYFRQGLSLRFDPEVLSYEKMEIVSPTELELKTVHAAEDATPGDVSVFIANEGSEEAEYAGAIQIVARETDTDGDEIDGDEEGTLPPDDSGSSGCRHSGAPSLWLLLLLAAAHSLRRKRDVIS